MIDNEIIIELRKLSFEVAKMKDELQLVRRLFEPQLPGEERHPMTFRPLTPFEYIVNDYNQMRERLLYLEAEQRGKNND